jgi:hypothetical protein
LYPHLAAKPPAGPGWVHETPDGEAVVAGVLLKEARRLEGGDIT